MTRRYASKGVEQEVEALLLDNSAEAEDKALKGQAHRLWRQGLDEFDTVRDDDSASRR